MNFTFFIALCFQIVACQQDDSNKNTTTAPPQYQPTDSATLAAVTQDTIPAKLAKTAIDSASRVIYLTFDDGPLAPTPFLKEIVEEKQVKMVEFAVGRHYQANPKFKTSLEALKLSPYFEVHNHSYSHAYGRYLHYYSSPQGSADDIIKNEDIIGNNSKIVRMPGRCIWATPTIKRGWSQSGGKTAEILLNNGFKVYGWDIEWEHYGNTLPKKTPEQFVAQIDDQFRRQAMVIPNHLVLLGHDEMLMKERGREDLRRILDMLKERGYIFEFLSYYPG